PYPGRGGGSGARVPRCPCPLPVSGAGGGLESYEERFVSRPDLHQWIRAPELRSRPRGALSYTTPLDMTSAEFGFPESGGLVAVNVMVLGLDEHNERILRDLPDAEQYRFHPLLSIEELLGRAEIPLRDLLDKAVRQLEAFEGRSTRSWGSGTSGELHGSDPVSPSRGVVLHELGSGGEM
ncbi:MAG: hypothetical protein ACRDTA_03980, partial [Pseudonocardiaceae bacterium]